MQPVQHLPPDFALAWELDLKHNTRLNIILQIIGLGWMALSGWLLNRCVLWMRPDFKYALDAGMSFDLLGGMLILLLIMMVTILLHELAHGLFFWLFSGHLPVFGIGPGYAFAAMPDWFFPRQKYLVIGLAPLLLLTALGLSASAFIPLNWLMGLLAGLVINAGGAIGDIYVCARIWKEPGNVWIKDTGDGFQVYRATGA